MDISQHIVLQHDHSRLCLVSSCRVVVGLSFDLKEDPVPECQHYQLE